MSYYVYALCDPACKPFYIGKGKGYRIFMHELNAHHGLESHTCRKIRSLHREGKEVQRQILWSDLSEAEAFDLERFTIATIGLENLTNRTSGGEGQTPKAPRMRRSHSEETKRKMSDSHLGKVLSAEHRENISRARTGMKQSESHLRNNGEAQRGKRLSEEHRRKISVSGKGLRRTEEQCGTFSEAQLERRRRERSGEVCRKPVTEEARRNMRAAQQRRRTRERIGDSPGILSAEHIALQRTVGEV